MKSLTILRQSLVLFALLFSVQIAGAQVSTYTFSQPSNPAGYVPVAGTFKQATGTTGAASLDDVSYPVTLPFTFNFGGTAFTNINVSTNGAVTFGTNTTTSYTAINDNTSGGGAISGFNRDIRGIFATTAATTTSSNVLTGVASIGTLATGQTITGTGIPTGTTITAIGTNTITMSAAATATSSTTVTVTVQAGHIDTATTGTAPNRTFVVQWTGFQIYNAANTSLNFQIRLAEGGGLASNQTVSIVYGDFLNLASSGTAQAGLRSNTGNTNYNNRTSTTSWSATSAGAAASATVSYSSSNLPSSGLLFLYTPPVGCTGTPTPGTAAAATNPVCAGSTSALSLTGTTSASGIGIQWQSSTDNIAFNPIPGATAAAYSASLGGSTMYYKAIVTCNGINPAPSNTLTVTVTSPPTVATVPFTESFESWISACGTSDRPGVNWLTTPTSGNNAWRRNDQGSTASWTTATGGAYTPVFTTGAYSARFHSTWAPTPLEGSMDLYINLSPTGTKTISFDHINTSGSDSLFVELSVNGGSSFSQIGRLALNSTWTGVTFTTTSTASSAIIRLRAKTDYGSTDIGVDNLKVTVPTCFAPTALNTPLLTSSNASLGFTPTGTPVAYQIEYGSSNFTLGSGTNVITNTNPYPISGLTGGNSYSFFVRAICGPGDTSAYSARYVFTTPCGSTGLPFSEQFNSYLPNTCWAEATGQLTAASTLTGTTSGWLADNYLNAAATNPAPSINLYFNNKRDWFITSSINLGTPAPGTNFVLEFNVGVVNWTTTTPTSMGSDDSVMVVVSTDNGLTWSKNNVLKLFTAANTPVSSTGGQRFFVPLDGYSGTIKVGFYATDGTIDDAPDYDVFIDSILVRTCAAPPQSLGTDAFICPSATVTLNAGNAGSTYLFSNSATTQTTQVTAAGAYSVKVTNAVGCVGRDTIVLTAGVNPAVNLGNDTTICPAATITLDAGNAGSTYLFSNSATTQAIGITAAGTYSVRVTNAQGCIGRDTVVIAQGVNPVVALGNDTAVCPGAGTTITLNAGNPGSTYLFSNNATTQTISVIAAGTYSVRVTNATKCVGRDTIVVINGVNPAVSLGNDTLICPGTFITLNAGNPGSKYLYSNAATTQTTNVTASGAYNVRVTNGQGCIGRDTIVIAAGTNPVASLGNDTTLCPAASIILNAGNPGSSYLFSNNATTQTTTITASGTYNVRVTNAQKCIGRDTIVITAGINPVVNLGADTSICPGKTIMLNAGNPGSSYLYNTGATAQSTSVTTAGTYSVRVTNAAKCVGRDTIVIMPGINPTVNLGPDTTVCYGYAVTLNAGNPGSTYLYSTGSTTQTLSVIPAGSYSVQVTNLQGCVGRDTINISVIPLALVNAIVANRAGLTVTFTSDAQNMSFHQWSFGDNTNSNVPTPVHAYTANGTYAVRLIIGNQCGNDTVTSTVTVRGVGTGSVNPGNHELRLYPNPASTHITLDNQSGLTIQSVTVLNSLGAIVIRKEGISSKKETLDISSLPAGAYMVRIQANGGTVLRRLQVLK